jgi:hypothetical protein
MHPDLLTIQSKCQSNPKTYSSISISLLVNLVLELLFLQANLHESGQFILKINLLIVRPFIPKIKGPAKWKG